MIKLALFGSTGSVGRQTLEVIDAFPGEVEVVALAARRSSQKLLLQAQKYRPSLVVSEEEPAREWFEHLPRGTEYLRGDEGLREAVKLADRVMNAISGVHGIKPAYYTLREGKTLLASNKESILCLAELVSENRERILPVDSEHNALFQLMEGKRKEDIKFMYLTASGGPFRKWSLEEMRKATPRDALRHPTWDMGAKITIDSATLMNKGFEMLEAKNLFGIELSRVKVVIHPQSVVHGILELRDGTFLMHASKTDMRVPIAHALFYPECKRNPFGETELPSLSPIGFEEVDGERFPCLYLARWAGEMGGVYVPVLVGADEEAVSLFLEGRIGFLDIPDIVEKTLSSVNIPDPDGVEDVVGAVEWARCKVRELYEKEYARA